jgi:hypothetical protein
MSRVQSLPLSAWQSDRSSYFEPVKKDLSGLSSSRPSDISLSAKSSEGYATQVLACIQWLRHLASNGYSLASPLTRLHIVECGVPKIAVLEAYGRVFEWPLFARQ